MAQSIANYEVSGEVTAFTSKFDAVLANKAQFTPQEQVATRCFAAKRNATTATATAVPGEDPLFTDFTASNIGTAANPMLPTTPSNNRMGEAMLQIRQEQVCRPGRRRLSDRAQPSKPPSALMLAGAPWQLRTWGDLGCLRCATWTSDLTKFCQAYEHTATSRA